MKILLVSEYFPPQTMGGGEINLALIAKALAEKKQDVSVLTSSFPPLPAYEENSQCKIYRRIKTGSNPNQLKGNFFRRFAFPKSLVQEIKKLHQEHSFDVIHLFGLALLAAPKLNHPNIVATIESYPSLCPKGDRMFQGKMECPHVCSALQFLPCQLKSKEIGKMKNKWYLKYNPLFLYFNYSLYKKLNKALGSCRLISISKYVQKLLAMHHQQSIVIGNIIEKRKASTVQLSHQKKRILYLGSLTAYKGPQILAEALKGLPYRCDFYGSGPLQPYLEKKIKEYQLDAAIHAPMLYEQVPQLYADADIVVVPSLWPEPFGRIPLEAQAAGKMVVASNTGGIPETAQEAILVPSGDVQALHQVLGSLAEKLPTVKKELLTLYAVEAIMAQLISAYNHTENPVSPATGH